MSCVGYAKDPELFIAYFWAWKVVMNDAKSVSTLLKSAYAFMAYIGLS